MQDTLDCPICGNRLRNVPQISSFFYPTQKQGSFIERTCNGLNHSVRFYVDSVNKTVDYLQLMLEPNYSYQLNIDFYNQRSQLRYYKSSDHFYLDLEIALEPDFPDLVNLKEKMAVYLAFS